MLIQADARALPLRDRCVQCVVTSPPYWGLRDYGTARWDGGDPVCQHRKVSDGIAAVATSTLGGGKKTTGHLQEGFVGDCRHCGARRIDRQIGLEATPDAYVATLVQVFREVRRVLRDDGVLWLNLGDSYASGEGGRHDDGRTSDPACGRNEKWQQQVARRDRRTSRQTGLKPKDLVGIPWRVAFALQADGWYLRQDIIWAKPNPMPESVTDRCTKAHEYLFLLAKAERYVYDADAIREPHLGVVQAAIGRVGDRKHTGQKTNAVPGKRPQGNFSTGGNNNAFAHPNGRNRRSVWTIATAPYPGAHFAVMPEALVEPCIRAGSRPGDLVLDPFGGTGTVVRVARRLNREGLACDLNPAYLELADDRISEVQIEFGFSA